jgi:hypothetical protein
MMPMFRVRSSGTALGMSSVARRDAGRDLVFFGVAIVESAVLTVVPFPRLRRQENLHAAHASGDHHR